MVESDAPTKTVAMITKFLPAGVQLALAICEFFFTYRTHTIDIAFHYEDSKIIYEININGYANNACYHSFTSVDELVSYPIIDNKNIQELWNDLET